MRTVTCRVTVYFDDPFWAMLYEREGEGWYEASRTVFGAEPKDYEVYAFLLQNWKQLRFSPPVQAGERATRPDNPKRRQRAARKAVEQARTGTKAQQALAAQREQGKQARRVRTRAEKEREAEERYEKTPAEAQGKAQGALNSAPCALFS